MLAHRGGGTPLPKGLDAAWDAAIGMCKMMVPRQRHYLGLAADVLAMEKQFSDASDARLREWGDEMRGIFLCDRQTPDDLLRAFALIREAAVRTVGLKPFLVQVAGALAIEAGSIVEMATGEGKTLTATMPATIGGWRGRGCHIITTTDYLAKRDAEWMGRVYKFFGLSVGIIQEGIQPAERKAAYQADITYCTNKEATADFLRDRLALGRLRGLSQALMAKIADGAGSGTDRVVQRGLHYAIVDEADSVLIDEAVTPLIISGEAPNQQQVEAFAQAAGLADKLSHGQHYRTNERYREIDLTDSGKTLLKDLSGSLGGIWTGARRREEMVTQALTAKQYYTLGKQYVIDEGKVVIVDEFTGRLMPDREWRDGLHQAVSAKESLEIQPPKDTYARVSFQRFFRLYRRLSGMTGTAAEAVREFWQIYHLPVVVIPPNRPRMRQHLPDRVFVNEKAKFQAVVEEIRRLNATGRPILVGTRSVRASELLSNMLSAGGLEHQVLNAVKHAEEAQIVAGAGHRGRITVSTNMAGRGTDIKLSQGCAEAGGLAVIATERHEAGRVDRQLYGRSGRQGDPGSAQAFVSLEDELVRRHAPHSTNIFAKRHAGATGEISTSLTRRLFEIAQRRAQRLSLRQRKGVLRTDDWLDEYLGFAGKEQ